MLYNFSFIIESQLAGSDYPGMDLENNLKLYWDNEIRTIVSLTESPLAMPESSGFDYLHIPIQDFRPPTLEQMAAFCGFCKKQLAENKPVVAHCHAGVGRTGTMLAAYLIHEKYAPQKAIQLVRTKRRGSIETKAQEQSLFQFQEYLNNSNT